MFPVNISLSTPGNFVVETFLLSMKAENSQQIQKHFQLVAQCQTCLQQAVQTKPDDSSDQN